MTTAVQPSVFAEILEALQVTVGQPEPRQSTPTPPAIRYAIGPVVVEVRCDLPDALDDLVHLYKHLPASDATGRPVVSIDVRATARFFGIARRFTIYGDGDELFSSLRPEEVLPYIEWAINYRVIARCRQFIQFHAATLARDGRGVMLVGQSGCGKSTLTAVLAAQGWQYLSDEFALLDPQTLRLHPFPKALCVKAGSFDVVRRVGLPLWTRRPYVKAFKGRVAFIAPTDLDAAPASAPLGAVLFPRYSADARPGLYPVARGDAAFRLAANAFNRANFGDHLVGTLADVVSTATCATLVPGDPAQTAAILESIVGAARAEQ